MKQFQHQQNNVKQILRRSVACPRCGTVVCTFFSRILSLSPKTKFICPSCGCICHTRSFPYIVMNTGSIIVFLLVITENWCKYVPRRYARAYIPVILTYLLIGSIMIIIFPLKEVKKK